MAFSVTIKRWHAVAAWTWNAGDDVCGICHTHYDGCPPDCKFPGDDSPVVWGACGHAFHIQCIQKWLASSNEQRCPMCRRAWEYKSAMEDEPQQQPGQTRNPGQAQEAARQQQQPPQQEPQQQPQDGDEIEELAGEESMSDLSRGSSQELPSTRLTLDYEVEDDMQLGEGEG